MFMFDHLVTVYLMTIQRESIDGANDISELYYHMMNIKTNSNYFAVLYTIMFRIFLNKHMLSHIEIDRIQLIGIYVNCII